MNKDFEICFVLCVYQALLVAHDDITNKNFEGDIDKSQEVMKGPQLLSPLPPVFNSTQEQVRYVNIRKSQTEPLVRLLTFFLVAPMSPEPFSQLIFV